ncbi:DMT family transporter [Lacinutrix undariae]
MKLITFYILAFTGGVLLAAQAAYNTQLSSIVKHPILAVVSASISSALFGSFFIFLFEKENIQYNAIQQVPWYLWGIGGLFSMIGISLYIYTIPKIGISKMIAIGLCGQIIFSLIAGKFGWLNLPTEPITTKRLIGAITMITGIILINSK